MRVFLEINYIRSINEPPTIKSYWKYERGNEGMKTRAMKNAMVRSGFEYILRNLQFSDNTKDNKSEKGCKVRSLMNHFKQSFSDSVSNNDSQIINKHIEKLKGLSSMKIYVNNKPIRWGFKFWYGCTSEPGYLYQFDLCLGKKESAEENLGSGIALKTTESLHKSYRMFF